jgi:hypothetical protein
VWGAGNLRTAAVGAEGQAMGGRCSGRRRSVTFQQCTCTAARDYNDCIADTIMIVLSGLLGYSRS